MEKRLADDRLGLADDIVYDSFDPMNLKEDLLRGIFEYGYKKPSLIQQRGIVPFTQGGDLILKGMFGPSRTSTYCIGVLQRLDLNMHKCQCLILVFSRGEVREVATAMRKLGKFMGVKVYECFEPTDNMSTDSHVVVVGFSIAQELVGRKLLCTEEIKMIVFDEADILMNSDYRVSEVHGIIDYLVSGRKNQIQIAAFCETMPKNSLGSNGSMSKMMSENLLVIQALKGYEELGLYGINKHKFLNVEKEDLKVETLERIMHRLREMWMLHAFHTMIFVPSRMLLPLTCKLRNDGYIFTATERDMKDQNEIKLITEEFLFSTGVILTTLSSSRGIIEQCSDIVRFIVNYNMCDIVESYISLVGWFRGVVAAICFSTCDDWTKLALLQQKHNIVFESVHLSQNWVEFLREEPVTTIKDAPIRHCMLVDDDDKGKIDTLSLPDCEGGLYDEFDIARTSVIFVNSPDRILYLADKLKLHSNYTVLTSKDSLLHDHDTTHPCLFITTDELDVKEKVHLVINFDVPLAHDNYHRRLAWCRSNGFFLLLGTQEDWFKIFDMQALYHVFIRWLPVDVADILKKMVLAQTGPSTSKKPRTLGQFKNESVPEP